MDIDDLAIKINQTARDKGFWDKDRNLGEMLMLAVSELAEALEEDREGRPTVWFKHQENCELMHLISQGLAEPVLVRITPEGQQGCTCVPKPEGALVEIADCIIRCCDTGQHLASRVLYSLGEVIEMKMAYNETRARMHGKAY